MLSTISSIRPRVFISMPSAAASRQPRPGQPRGRAACRRTCPTRGDEDDQRRRAATRRPPQTRPICGAHAGEGEEGRQEQHDDEVLQALRVSSRASAAVVRDDRAEQEGAEEGVDADALGRQRRQQQAPRSTTRQHVAAASPLRSCGADQRAASERPHDSSMTRDVGERQARRSAGRSPARAWATPTTNASRHQAVTSSTAAQVSAIDAERASCACRGRSGCAPAPGKP